MSCYYKGGPLKQTLVQSVEKATVASFSGPWCALVLPLGIFGMLWNTTLLVVHGRPSRK